MFHETLEDMLPHCDFLSLHCNVTPATRGMMNAQRFALLPDGAILVNAARGAIVDDDALVEALRSGRLRAAGIDAYNNEPNVDPRIVALAATRSSCRTSAAPRARRGTRWDSARSTTSTRFSPGASPATASRSRMVTRACDGPGP